MQFRLTGGAGEPCQDPEACLAYRRKPIAGELYSDLRSCDLCTLGSKRAREDAEARREAQIRACLEANQGIPVEDVEEEPEVLYPPFSALLS